MNGRMNPPNDASTWKKQPKSLAISAISLMGSTNPSVVVPAVATIARVFLLTFSIMLSTLAR